MATTHIIGADISKATIDLALLPQGTHLTIPNNAEGFKKLKTWLKANKVATDRCRLILEHTGLYSFGFEQYLSNDGMAFSKVSGLELKRSMGLVRGKSDRIDAMRIARFGQQKGGDLAPYIPLTKNLSKLSYLATMRARLVRQRAAAITAVAETAPAMELSESDEAVKIQRRIIKAYDREIEKTEQLIADLIASDPELNHNYRLLGSIVGVGPVLATRMIIATRNFTCFADARKFACYSGVAPFEHSSGTSVKGRTRVSHIAAKEIKTLLSLAARSAVQHDPELKEYYQKKTAAGKQKMSVLNVVRNKLIYRIFAVIKRKSPFLKDINMYKEMKNLHEPQS